MRRQACIGRASSAVVTVGLCPESGWRPLAAAGVCDRQVRVCRTGGTVVAGNASITSGDRQHHRSTSPARTRRSTGRASTSARRERPLRAAQQQLGRAQPGARRRSVAASSAACRPTARCSWSTPTACCSAQGAQVNVGGLVASTLRHHRRRLHGRPLQVRRRERRRGPQPGHRSTPTAAMSRCWARTSATKA